MSIQHPIRIVTGWRRGVRRIGFLLGTLRYALQPSRYPLFRYSRAHNGLWSSLDLEREAMLTKMVVAPDGSYLTTLSLPRYPSAAFDNAAARGALNTCAVGSPMKTAIDNVFLGITALCSYHCEHCYERPNINRGEDLPVDRWVEIVREVQDLGVGVIIFSGGEPMQRYDAVLQILARADLGRSDFHLHTSGNGVTRARARELRDAGLTAVAVGLDDVDPARHDRFRGSVGSFRRAVAALEYFAEAGVMTYTNLCMTKEFVRSGGLPQYLDLVKGLGVGIVQLLEPRPCGGFAGRVTDDLFDESDREAVRKFVRLANTDRPYAEHPLMYNVFEIERSRSLGCTMGGWTTFVIDSAGNVRPCVFIPVSFGSVLKEDLSTIFTRMREAVPHPLRNGCPASAIDALIERTAPQDIGSFIPFSRVEAVWKDATT